MGCCSGRCMSISLCCVQSITAVERQVFDFSGYQWAPIMVNFFHIIMVISGLFGAVQYHSRYVIMYSSWTFVWIGWNVFVSCLYSDLGGLSKFAASQEGWIGGIVSSPPSIRWFSLSNHQKDSHSLSSGVSSHSSWWKNNGPGCNSQNPPSDIWQDQHNPKSTTVSSCWLDYQYIEVSHCAAQLFVSLSGVIYSCYLVSTLSEEESYYK